MDLLLKTAPHFRLRHVKFSQVAVVRSTIPSRTMSNSTPNSITASPAVGQLIFHNGKEYSTIKEGLAYILIPASASTVPQSNPKGDNEAQSVFYNPIQQFNRDLTMLAVKAYGEEAIARKKLEMERSQKQLFNKKGRKRKRSEHANGENAPVKVTRSDAGDNAKEGDDSRTIDPPNQAKKDTTGPTTVTNDDAGLGEHTEADRTTASGMDVPLASSSTAVDPLLDSGAINANSVDRTHDKDSSERLRQPSFRILDALSATGLRALRYAHEIPFATAITANDLLPTATALIDLNVQHNNLTDKITSVTGNALTHMYGLVGDEIENRGRPRASKKYDVIDLDPYGTAAPFLDAALQAVRDDGGLLCVTCTDGGVWASAGYPEKSYSLYGGVPIKGQQSHEGGLRLILHAIASSAARYGLAIEPLLSLSIDFYARVFVRIRKSAADVKFLAGKTMIVYSCDSGCGAWSTQLLARNKLQQNKSGNGTFYKHVIAQAPTAGELCEHCGSKTHIAGPMYAGPLHSPAFIRRIVDDLPNVSQETYATKARIEGMLTVALEEDMPPLETPSSPSRASLPLAKKGKSEDPAAIDHYPFFFIPSVLSKVIHCVTPHENALRGALRHLGYRVTRSHTKPGSIKTDAPWSVIWEVMREWARQKAPPKDGTIKKGTAGWTIMGFDKEKGASTVMDNVADGQADGDHKPNANGEISEEKPKIVFDEELGKERDTRKLVRYQLNPRENWGPMNRAKGH